MNYIFWNFSKYEELKNISIHVSSNFSLKVEAKIFWKHHKNKKYIPHMFQTGKFTGYSSPVNTRQQIIIIFIMQTCWNMFKEKSLHFSLWNICYILIYFCSIIPSLCLSTAASFFFSFLLIRIDGSSCTSTCNLIN